MRTGYIPTGLENRGTLRRRNEDVGNRVQYINIESDADPSDSYYGMNADGVVGDSFFESRDGKGLY
ncbi:hypothetical protein Bca52824_064503 [Brassica carinata]|uniref:Uncharacterized protein n=1 Tax=Brassica carinata TaxID=52824 RepID=A0A8X7QHN2_BRACI|nr:hypothetical protein Bca52824_064503 [Brassica carinata]